jgi:hypothetical protein
MAGIMMKTGVEDAPAPVISTGVARMTAGVFAWVELDSCDMDGPLALADVAERAGDKASLIPDINLRRTANARTFRIALKPRIEPSAAEPQPREEIPNNKFQTNTKHQIPKIQARRSCFEFW